MIKLLATIGLILSCYAVYVEYKMEHKAEDEEFTALCDIQAIGASCSAVFALPQGKMLSYFGIIEKGHVLDLPNAALGALFYLQQLLFSGNNKLIDTIMVSGALGSSIFLAYQLTFVLGDLCVLCWTTHVINASLFYLTVFGGDAKKKTKVA